MKTKSILSLIFLFSSVFGFSQTDWSELIKEKPQTALEEAEKMYVEALKSKDTPKLIHSLIIITNCKTLLDADSLPSMIMDIENIFPQIESKDDKAMFYSLLAELYEIYYSNIRFKITSNTPLIDVIPERIEEWSSNVFFNKISEYALASIKDAAFLQQVNVNKYNVVLIEGKDSEILRPTLYDFLAHRSIDRLKYINSINGNTLIDLNSNFFLPIEQFINLKIENEGTENKILNIYQDLLRFRLKDSNKPALLIADLERLEYNAQIGGVLSVYYSALIRLADLYKDSPYVVEVTYKINNIIYTYYKSPMFSIEEKFRGRLSFMNFSNPDDLSFDFNDLTKALENAHNLMEKFSDYSRINLMKNFIEQVEQSSINFNFDSMVYTDTLSVKMNYYNTDYFKLQVYKFDENSKEYFNKNANNKSQNKTLIFETEYNLEKKLYYQDSIFKIQLKEIGLYEVVAFTTQSDTAKQIVEKSPFITTHSIMNNKVRFCVREAISGKPVKDASIIIYKEESLENSEKYYSQEKILKTDSDGIAVYSRENQSKSNYSLYFEVVNKKNPQGSIRSINAFTRNVTESVSLIQLFTDRKVYRPGQTVYFSGISWNSYADSIDINKDKEYTIQLNDSRGKEISKLTLKTNEWGSLSGSFTIPQEILSGRFYIQTEEGLIDFEVAEYKRPSLEVIFNPIKDSYRFGDSINVTGKIQSYSGIPIAGTNIKYTIRLNSFYPIIGRSIENIIGDLTSDSNGNFSITFKSNKPSFNAAPLLRYPGFYYNIELEVTDEKGESQQYTERISIGEQPFYINLDVATYIDKNSNTIISIKAINENNQSSLDKEINYSISLLKPLSKLSESYQIKEEEIERIVKEGKINTLHDSLIINFRDFPSGAYLIKAYGKDEIGKVIENKQIFFLYSRNDKKPPIFTYDWYVPIKTKCKIGEEAEILLGTSAKNVYILYEIFKGQEVLDKKVLKLSQESKIIKIPYKEEYGSRITVNASFVKDRKFFNHSTNIYKEDKNRELNFFISTFRDKLYPGQEEQWDFKILNKSGQPIISEVMAVMYDRSLDKIRENSWSFRPENYLYMPTLSWELPFNYRSRRSLYPKIPYKRSSVEPLKFDKLNLYYLKTFQERNSIRIRGTSAPADGEEDMLMGKMASSDYANIKLAGRATSAQSEVITGSIRENFSETAFFYPQILTNENGEFSIHFSVPEAITGWKFMAIAHTKDLDYGYLEKEIVTHKDIMVIPNIPRFFRRGDKNILKATVINQTEITQTGTATLELFIPATEEVIFTQAVDFSTKALSNFTVSFNFEIPDNIDIIGYRIVAKTPTFSDGEQHLLVVAPDEIILTETLPFFSNQIGVSNYELKPSTNKRKDTQLTLEVTANPTWYVVMAIPSLQEPSSKNIINLTAALYVNSVGASILQQNPDVANALQIWTKDKSKNDLFSSPLEKNSELKSVMLDLTPWSQNAVRESENIRSLSRLSDLNQITYTQDNLLSEILNLQREDGGWSWFNGMNSNRFVTSNTLTILARATLTGHSFGQNSTAAQIKALQYLDKKIIEDYKQKDKNSTITYPQLVYLYTRSFYRDIPITDALEAHKYYMSLLEKQWLNFNMYEKALAASTLYRYGFNDLAKRIINSLREYATISPEMGMYWANNRSSSYYINSAILTHVAIMEAFYEIDRKEEETESMKLWLLRQKQSQSWENVPSTVDAIYALLLTGKTNLNTNEELKIKLGDNEINTNNSPLTPGYTKVSLRPEQIKDNMFNITLEKKTNIPTWGALYLQYQSKLNEVRKTRNSIINIDKELFVENNTTQGKQLVPIKDKLKTGDKVIIRLTVSLDKDMQFVQISDLRAACFEPIQQLSGTQYKYNTYYYEEIKDAVTNLYFDFLPKGKYIFEYNVWVNQSGTYQDGIATIQCLYAPEYISYSLPSKLTIE